MESDVNPNQEVDHDDRIASLLMPWYFKERSRLRDNHKSFIHYSNAASVFAVLESREWWLRRADIMNDFSEIKYGRYCLEYSIDRNFEQTKSALSSLGNGMTSAFSQTLDEQINKIVGQTFVASFAEHSTDAKLPESRYGKLSMWRAYGGENPVAVVLRRESFFGNSIGVNALLLPVMYQDENQFEQRFREFLDGITQNVELLKEQDVDVLPKLLSFMVLAMILSTKHPAFMEEEEWRLVYCPGIGDEPSKHIELSPLTIGGLPQVVARFPLRDEPALRLHDVELDKIIESILIGPTVFPQEVAAALRMKLVSCGVSNPTDKVRITSIPLRR